MPDWQFEFGGPDEAARPAPYDWADLSAASERMREASDQARAAADELARAVLAALGSGQTIAEVADRSYLDQPTVQRIVDTGRIY